MPLSPEKPDVSSLSLRSKRRIVITVLALVGVALFVSVVGSFSPACASCHRPQAAASAAGVHANISCYSCHLEDGAWGIASAKADELLGMYPRVLLGGTPTRPATQTSRDACLSCHAAVLEDVVSARGLNIKHESCAAGASCDTCHATTAHGDAVRWIGTPVMEQCTSCHTNRGASIVCETCHGADSGPRSTAPTPWRVTHGEKWERTHGMGDLDSCVVCHPRGYPVSFCTKCHGVDVPHGPDFGEMHGHLAMEDRGACTTCHTSSTFCSACHAIEMPHPDTFLEAHPTIAKDRNDPACVRCHLATDCAECHANHIHPGGGKGMPLPWTFTDEKLRAKESK